MIDQPKKVAIQLLFLGAAVIVSIAWIDLPVAKFVHARFGRPSALLPLSMAADYAPYVSLVLLLVLGIRSVLAHPLSRAESLVFVCCIGMIVAAGINAAGEVIFARVAPEMLLSAGERPLQTGAHGFTFFRVGGEFRSFPSWPQALTCAVAVLVPLYHPRLRIVSAVAALLLGSLLVALNRHFIADVIAGTFVGILSGAIALGLWDWLCPFFLTARNN